MNYENIKLVHLIDGIDIEYNNTGFFVEYNKETLFPFDSSNNFIQKFTYWSDIISFEIDSIINNCDRSIDIEEESFLYYSFQYQVSFAHYMTQCLPKLNQFLMLKNTKLIIPRSTYTELCKEILKILDISDDRIIVLENNTIYNFKNLHTVPHIGPEWDGPGGSINKNGISIYNLIRKNIGIINNIDPYRKVYLKRDGISNKKFGNGEIGITRRIVNEDEVISFLKDNGFEIIHLGDKTIIEKKELLSNIKILITQLGANCMNLVFCNKPDKILLLSNDHPVAKDYYTDICSIVNNSNVDKSIFCYNSLNCDEDPKNYTNSPFIVNLNDIKKYIDSQ